MVTQQSNEVKASDEQKNKSITLAKNPTFILFYLFYIYFLSMAYKKLKKLRQKGKNLDSRIIAKK